MEEKEIYEMAVHTFGRESQLNMMIEEASELIQAIQKNRRGINTPNDVLAEVVDCQIMLTQMKFMLNDEKKYDRIMVYKLERLAKLIKTEENHKMMRFRLDKRFEKLADPTTNQKA